MSNDNDELFDEAVEYFNTLEGQVISGWLPEPVCVKTAWYMYWFAKDDFQKTLRLWAILQKCSSVLFSIHPYIKKLMVGGFHGIDVTLGCDFSEEDIRQMMTLQAKNDRRKAVGSHIDANDTIVVELEPEITE